MNKKLLAVAFAAVLTLSSCAVKNANLEQQEAEAKVSVADTERTQTTEISTVEVTEATTLPEETTAQSKPVAQPSGLSTKKREHSYGVAKDGKPHNISVEAQKYFESLGVNAFCLDTKTEEKVLYLTFDCGWENGCTSQVLDTLKEKNVPAAFFCTLDHIDSEPELIRRMIDEGHIVGNHSANHPDFSQISREKMTSEIKECENRLVNDFGYTPVFFRYPEGAYSENSLDLVDSLGYKTAFWSCAYADWDVDNPKGADYAFETVTARLHPGAVILLHSVSPDNAEALGRIIDYAREQGYEFRALTDFPV